MSILKITKDNFEQEVLKAKGTVILDFWAEWCGPCKMQAPIFDQVAGELPQVKFGKVNIDVEMELAQKFRVMSIPTLMIFKDGKPAQTLMGLHRAEDIKKALE